MLKKLYDKSKILFALSWVVVYCVLMSAGDSLSELIGIEKSITVFVGVSLSLILLVFLGKNGLFETYGLCGSKISAREMLFYVPIVLLLSANLWFGVTFNYGAAESILYIFAMFCVGFLEEVIFRGLLFNAMRKDGERTAVVVSSVTFGIGHIINLVNGSGAELLPNLFQVVYATSAGFMFVMIYKKTKSLFVCIATHGLFNALSVFALDAPTVKTHLISCTLITVITGAYAVYISTLRQREKR